MLFSTIYTVSVAISVKSWLLIITAEIFILISSIKSTVFIFILDLLRVIIHACITIIHLTSVNSRG